jgi:thioredoxin 1
MGNAALEINDANFKAEVLGSKLPVLVDFTAEWCPPCRALGPIVEELAADFVGRLKVGKLDVDANQEVVQALGIQSMPTLLIFKGGKVAEAVVGFRAKPDLQKLLERHA